METQRGASCGVWREGEVELPVMLIGPTEDLGADAGPGILFLPSRFLALQRAPPSSGVCL